MSSNVVFKLDHREGKLKELFDQHKPFTVVYENLEYGDAQLVYKNEVVLLFERKTLADLTASIKDGRYKNQKTRMLHSYRHTQYYYIVEGSLSFGNTVQPLLSVESALINMMLRDHIGVFQTATLRQTYELLCGIVKRFMAEPDKYLVAPELREQVVVETSQGDSVEKVYEKVLCQIPGVSQKSAAALQERWPTFQRFYAELTAATAEQRVSLLNDVKVNGRKISKRIVEGVLKYLF
jgi:ERCC4-type nuclease